eukprot:350566-Chlamydomonas_euryale.AAC.7
MRGSSQCMSDWMPHRHRCSRAMHGAWLARPAPTHATVPLRGRPRTSCRTPDHASCIKMEANARITRPDPHPTPRIPHPIPHHNPNPPAAHPPTLSRSDSTTSGSEKLLSAERRSCCATSSCCNSGTVCLSQPSSTVWPFSRRSYVPRLMLDTASATSLEMTPMMDAYVKVPRMCRQISTARAVGRNASSSKTARRGCRGRGMGGVGVGSQKVLRMCRQISAACAVGRNVSSSQTARREGHDGGGVEVPRIQ